MKKTKQARSPRLPTSRTPQKVSKKSVRERTVPWQEIRDKLLTDPEVRFHYEDLRFRRAIARSLAEARKRAGLTQAQLAVKVGTTQTSIARFEAGRAGVPSLRFLDRVARALGLRVTLTLGKVRAA